MASITRTISAKVDKTGKAELMLRLSIDRNHKQRIKSGIFIAASRFRDGVIIKPRANRREAEELTQAENELINIERFLLSLCQKNEPERLTKEFITDSINHYRHPEMDVYKPVGLFVALNEFIATSGLSVARLNHYRVLCRSLARFEACKRKQHKEYRLTFESITEETLMDFAQFLRDEPELFEKYPEIYEEIPAITRSQRKPKKPLPRGENTISGEMKRFRAFFNWAIRKDYTANYPFAKFKISSEKYGTPFYLTIDERNTLADFDFSRRPGLATQRDIFIFQCLTGCRVSDLYGLTSESVVAGAIEYIPRKTKGERPEVVRVPLNPSAAELVAKYGATDGKPLFPFISSQKYNDAIKELLKLAGIDRVVTVLNPTTGEEEKRPIYEVASSHIARRTFIGNLYKKVKDPNLVGSLSGHKEGSRAFSRYREIDDDIKKELVNLL
ncbi:MAG: site-specific integrase [Bacteroides sp.]|nr:site-specific integrase [Bacteroides sp.]